MYEWIFVWKGPRWFQIRRDSLVIILMRIFGSITFFFSVILLGLLIPIMICLGICGFLIPFYGTYHYWRTTLSGSIFSSNGNSDEVSFEAMLGLILSSAYFLSLFILLLLVPSVYRFQSTHKDIYDFSDHTILGSDAFYVVGLDAILEEAYVRYRSVLGKEKLKETLESKTNVDAAKCILKFLTGVERI
jgi:hypothetical protein